MEGTYLSRHVHEQHSSDGSLSLAVPLLRSVQSVGLENTEQVLLPAGRQNTNTHTPVTQSNWLSHKEDCNRFKCATWHQVRQRTRVLLVTQTSHGKETVDGGLSQSCRPIWGLQPGCPAPEETQRRLWVLSIIRQCFLYCNILNKKKSSIISY